MSRLIDALSLLLMGLAGVAFFLGVDSIGEQQDVRALYWLAMGGLLLRGATELLRPSGAR